MTVWDELAKKNKAKCPFCNRPTYVVAYGFSKKDKSPLTVTVNCYKCDKWMTYSVNSSGTFKLCGTCKGKGYTVIKDD